MTLDAAANLHWNIKPFHFGLEKMPYSVKHHFFSSVGCFNAQSFARGRQFVGYGVSVKRHTQFRCGREDEMAVSGCGYRFCEKLLRKRRQGHDVQIILVLIPRVRDVPDWAVRPKSNKFIFSSGSDLVATLAQQNGKLDHCSGLNLTWGSMAIAPVPQRLQFLMGEKTRPPLAR